MIDVTFPPDWIPLTHQVPEYGKRVLLATPEIEPVIGYLDYITTTKNSTSYGFMQGYDYVSFDPTHWMPLPDTNCLLWD